MFWQSHQICLAVFIKLVVLIHAMHGQVADFDNAKLVDFSEIRLPRLLLLVMPDNLGTCEIVRKCNVASVCFQFDLDTFFRFNCLMRPLPTAPSIIRPVNSSMMMTLPSLTM